MRVLRVLTLLVIFLPEFLHAQSFYAVRRERSLIFSVGTGMSTYFGELKSDGFNVDTKLNMNAGLQYFVTNRISARLEFNYLRLEGSDAEENSPERYGRNLSFFSNNYELSLSGQVHLFPNSLRFYQRPVLNAYGIAGFGMLYMNPKAELDGETYALQPLQTEGEEYSKIQPVIIYGIGGKVKISPFFNVSLEVAWRKLFTDYLDDVSTVYKDQASFTDPIAAQLADRRPEIGLPLAPTGSVRGNPDSKDAYMAANLKLEFYLPSNFLFGERSNSQRKLYKSKRKAYYKRR